jgi:hypothetical protein
MESSERRTVFRDLSAWYSTASISKAGPSIFEFWLQGELVKIFER